MRDLKIKIRFDGDVPGLAEHKLSLRAFAPTLKALSNAFLGTTTDLLMTSNGIGRSAAKNKAKVVDVLLSSIEEGSTVPVFDFIDTTNDLFLKDEAILKFFEDMKKESEGKHVNKYVREFFSSIPAGAYMSKFGLYDDGMLIDSFKLSREELPSEESPFLTVNVHDVEIVSIGVIPGSEFVEVFFLSEGFKGNKVKCKSSQAIVDRVYSNKIKNTKAQISYNPNTKRYRILAIFEKTPEVISRSERRAKIMSRWGDSLDLLKSSGD